MQSHLKVKVVSLHAEMSYIRRQEERWKKRAKHARAWQKKQTEEAQKAIAFLEVMNAESNFWSLRQHRDGMKPDARNTHLAYGCIKGRPYSQMEYLCYGVLKGYGTTEPNWNKIETIVTRFTKDEADAQGVMQRFAEWLAEAKYWYEGNLDRIKLAAEERVKLRLTRNNDTTYQAEKKARGEAMKNANLGVYS